MYRENILKKYDLTEEEFDDAIEQAVSFGNIFNVQAMIALAELLTIGDIPTVKNVNN